MICPTCRSEVKLGTQFSVAVHGVFVCPHCATRLEVKTTAARVFDWVIELVLFPLGLVLLFIADLSYVFMGAYLLSLFLAWFLIARMSIKKKLNL